MTQKSTESNTPHFRASLNGSYSISLDNLEDWSTMDGTSSATTYSLSDQTKEFTAQKQGLQKPETKHCKKEGKASKGSSKSVSRFAKFGKGNNGGGGSLREGTGGVIKRNSSFSKSFFLSTKFPSSRMSTSMSNISSSGDRSKKCHSPTVSFHAPSAPTSPSRPSLKVTNKMSFGSQNPSLNSSNGSLVSHSEYHSPPTSTPIKEGGPMPSFGSPVVSPITEIKSGSHISRQSSRFQGYRISAFGPGGSLRETKISEHSGLRLPIVKLNSSKSNSNSPVGGPREYPKRFSSMIKGKGHNFAKEEAAYGPDDHVGPRWKLWKQKTCPDLLKTASTDNLFRYVHSSLLKHASLCFVFRL